MLPAGQNVPGSQAVPSVTPSAQYFPTSHNVFTDGSGQKYPASHFPYLVLPSGQDVLGLHFILLVTPSAQ